MDVSSIIRKHQRFSFWRSPTVDGKILQYVFIFLVLISFSLSVLSYEYLLSENLKSLYNLSLAQRASMVLLFYALADFLIRYFIVPLPSLDIYPFLTLPIPREKITRALVFQSLSSIWSFVLLVPAIIGMIVVWTLDISVGLQFCFAFFLLGIVLFNNLLNYYIQLDFKRFRFGLYGMVFVLAIFISLQVKGYYDSITPLAEVITFLNSSYFFYFLPSVGAYFVYSDLIKRISKRLTILNNPLEEASHLGLEFFNKWGSIGIQIKRELLIYVREKGARNFLVMMFLFVFYPFLIGSTDSIPIDMIYVLFIFYPSIGYLSSGLGFHTYHYEALDYYVRPRDFILSKYGTSLILSVTTLILACIIYGLTKPNLLNNIYLAFLMVTGVVNWLFLYVGLTFVIPRDPDQKNIFNTQMKFDFRIMIFTGLVIFVPSILWMLITKFHGEKTTYIVFIIIGLVAFLCYELWIAWLVKVLHREKHKMIKIFKEFNND